MIREYFTPDEFNSMVRDLAQRIVNLAVAKGILASPGNAVVRPLMPTDLGATADNWEQTFTASGLQTVYSGSVKDYQIVVIYGIRILSNECNVDHIVFKTPTETKDLWEVNPAKVREDATAISTTQVIYENNQDFEIQFYENLPSGATSDTTKIQLLGLVVEPAGKTLTNPNWPNF